MPAAIGKVAGKSVAAAAAAAAIASALAVAAAAPRAGGMEAENPWEEARKRAIRPVPEEFAAKSSRVAEGGAARGMTIEHYGRGTVGPDGAERSPLIFSMRAKEARSEREAVRLSGVDLFYLVGNAVEQGRRPATSDAGGAGDSGALVRMPPGSRLIVLAPRGAYFPAKSMGVAEGPAEIKTVRESDGAVLWSLSAERLYWKYWEDDVRKLNHMFLFTFDPDGAAGDCGVSGDFRGGETAGRPGGLRISARGMIFEGVSMVGERQPRFDRLHVVFGSEVEAKFEDGGEEGGTGNTDGKRNIEGNRSGGATRVRCSGPCEIELEAPPGAKDGEKLRRARFFDGVECVRTGGRLPYAGPSSERGGERDRKPAGKAGGSPGENPPEGRPAEAEYTEKITCGRLSLEYALDDPWNRPRRATAEGGVVYEGRPVGSAARGDGGEEGGGIVRIEGERLAMDEAAGKIEIFGSPAKVTDARGRFEAPEIICDRRDGTIISPAGGRKRLILKANSDGAGGGAGGGSPEAAAPAAKGEPGVEAKGR